MVSPVSWGYHRPDPSLSARDCPERTSALCWLCCRNLLHGYGLAMPGNLAAMAGPGRAGADILCPAMAAAQVNAQLRDRIKRAQTLDQKIGVHLGIMAASVAPAEHV